MGWRLVELLEERPWLAFVDPEAAGLFLIAAKGNQTMSKERISDADLLRELAKQPGVAREVNAEVLERVENIAAKLDVMPGTAEPAEPGSLDVDAAILEGIATILPKEAGLPRQELLRIALWLKSLPEPPCEYCDGHGVFFPKRGFELREEKEVRIRVCDCKAGTKIEFANLEQVVFELIRGERLVEEQCTPA